MLPVSKSRRVLGSMVIGLALVLLKTLAAIGINRPLLPIADTKLGERGWVEVRLVSQEVV
jgi:hypothetical protein